MSKPPKRPKTGREADRAFSQPPFVVENGGKHKKVKVNGKLVCCYNVHSGELSPGAQADIAKVLFKYGALATLTLACLGLLSGVLL